ncbi:peptidyl-prolyl cis-trans isomerase [Motiliproteus sp. SC1-56]|uniref:peptidylprolyl isomerase n=1 Tax=Motiliproteus sp. SC1-56 TaxID=2799565 RepID=UPI001A908370|nr:peptidylprolyl isomerase [Motiliproteus sp. SC1-56]
MGNRVVLGQAEVLGARLLREPLLHFLLLGAGVFALFSALDDPAVAPPTQLVVSEAQVTRLAQRFEATWSRAPDTEELARLVDRYVNEEVLVREARALGLDREDAVVRQRLAQKMRFLLEGGQAENEPTEAVLVAHLAAHPERFARQPRLAFEQVPLAVGADAERALAALRQGAAPHSLITTPTLLPAVLSLSPETAVDGAFGEGFFQQVAELPPGRWSGPVRSAFGQHLVRVTGRVAGGLPPLESVAEQVARDWRASRRAELAEGRLEALKGRYQIALPAPIIAERI